MKRKILAIALATLALFAWNAISWMVLPFHGNSLQTLPDAVVKFTSLSSVRLESGVYHYPGLPDDNSPESLKELEQKLATGPRIPLMVYQPGPSKLFNPTDFIKSLAFNLLTVIVLLFLLVKLKSSGLKSTIATCLIIAMLVALVSDLALMNWYKLPLKFVLPGIIDHMVGLSICGTIIFYLFLKRNHYAA